MKFSFCSIFSLFYYYTSFHVQSQDNIFTITPNNSICVGDSVIITCYLYPPTADGYADFGLLSVNESNSEFASAINNDYGHLGYTATVAIPIMGDSARIQLNITSFQVSDSNTVFGCHAQFASDGTDAGVMINGTATLAVPPSPPVSLTAGYNSPTCSGTVQLAWTPGASDRDIEMYFLSLNGVMLASVGTTISYNYMANLEKITNTYSIYAMSCAGTSTQTSAIPISFSSPPVSPVVTLSQPNSTCSNLQIRWSIPNSQRHRFLLHRYNALIADTRDNQYTDNTQLNISTVYEYSVVAISCAGSSTAGVMSVSIGTSLATDPPLYLSYNSTANEVFIGWSLNKQLPTISLTYSLTLIYSYTQDAVSYTYSSVDTFTQLSTDTNHTRMLTQQPFYSSNPVQIELSALISIVEQCATPFSDIAVYSVYTTEYTPQVVETGLVDTSVIIYIFLIALIILILLIFISVTIVMTYFLMKMHRKNSKPKATTQPAHPYEYIDLDYLPQNMPPNRNTVPTHYTEMHSAVPEPPPQYGNLK